MNERSRRFIRHEFKEYYTKANLILPENIQEREFAFVPIDQYYPEKQRMHRHMGFNTEGKLREYILSNVPAHAYYSTASYKYPQENNMDRKEWIGADLIFDIDADHIIPESDLQLYSHEELLELSKQEVLKLIDVLKVQFGFATRDMKIVFSGSRGYHAHVTSTTIQKMRSKERREICDYITARGVDADSFIREAEGDKQQRSRQIITTGWGLHIHNEMIRFLTEIANMEDEKQAIKTIRNISGATKLTAQKILRLAKDQTVMPRIKNHELPTPLDKRIKENLLTIATILATTKHACTIDEPVTTDIKRLIRIPGSLHGKTGLIAMPISMEQLDAFTPLTDAIGFSNAPIKIVATNECYAALNGNTFKLRKGEVATTPKYCALYLICRNATEAI